LEAQMNMLARGLVVLVALLHVGFLVLEMFLWNQGFYNGILAAGLLWGALRNDRSFMIFFLLAVIAAGVFGAFTAKISILYMQAAPGLVALLAVLAAKPRAA
jgi:putative membrane protein